MPRPAAASIGLVDSETELRMLHTLRLKGFVDVEGIASIVGLEPTQTREALADLGRAELVTTRGEPTNVWMLTPKGRARGEALAGAEIDTAGVRSEVELCYSDFLKLNPVFLDLCTDWQVRVIHGERVINDHLDSDYDAEMIARLLNIHDEISELCRHFGSLLDRSSGYGERFDFAIAKVVGGETDWFTKPVIESYHTVWFELHEDFLASLGLHRAREESR